MISTYHTTTTPDEAYLGISIFLVIYLFIASLFVVSLSIFHTYLIISDRTTREIILGLDSKNSRGCYHNCFTKFCKQSYKFKLYQNIEDSNDKLNFYSTFSSQALRIFQSTDKEMGSFISKSTAQHFDNTANINVG